MIFKIPSCCCCLLLLQLFFAPMGAIDGHLLEPAEVHCTYLLGSTSLPPSVGLKPGLPPPSAMTQMLRKQSLTDGQQQHGCSHAGIH
jgi:hypothetical protein